MAFLSLSDFLLSYILFGDKLSGSLFEELLVDPLFFGVAKIKIDHQYTGIHKLNVTVTRIIQYPNKKLKIILLDSLICKRYLIFKV